MKLVSDATLLPLPPASGYTVTALGPLLARGLKFACVLADPPWRYDRNPRGAAARHFPTMSIDEIAALPVSELVTDDAHLHLWTTAAMLFDARRVIEVWGFSYKGVLIWTKPQMGTGHYWRNACEFLLLGVRGNLTFRDRTIPNWTCLDRHDHSQKPERIRVLIERVSPPPYLDLFGRRAVHDWVVFGNDIDRGLFDGDVMALG